MKTPGYLLGVDVGSSSCKAVLVGETGLVLASGQKSYPTRYPRPGWAEQDPGDWYQGFCDAVRTCLIEAGATGSQVIALSLTGPAHNAVLLDEHNRLLRPVIHWSDLRSIPEADLLDERFREHIFEITYQRANPGWTLAQLLWIRQNEPEIWPKISRILLQKDYIGYRLTGSWTTDRYDAIGTQLYDIVKGDWSRELCDFIELNPTALPPVLEATQVAGRITPTAAGETGLRQGTPVAVGSGDSVVEALGVGVLKPGQCIVKLATSGAANVVTSRPIPDSRTMTYCHLVPGRWYTITATNSGAASALWFREAFNFDNLGEGLPAMERLAEQVEPGSRGLIFHPYLQGERAPHWDPLLRGDFIGVTVEHRQKHFARAVFEGVVYSLRDCLEMLKDLGFEIDQIYLLGGGTRSPLWRQIVADVFGRPLYCVMGDATAFGAALVAGIAGKVYADISEASQLSLRAEMLEPSHEASIRYEELFTLYRIITERLKPVLHALSELYLKTNEVKRMDHGVENEN